MTARRRIVFAFGIGLLAPFASLGQTQARVRLIGWLHDRDPTDPLELQYEDSLKAGLRERGYIEGKDYKIEKRFATSSGNLPLLAADLVALKADIIVAMSTPAAIAAHKITREIPIVTNASDPVSNGLAASLSHPAGNVTGMTSLSSELYVKRVDLLRQLVPTIQRVAFLYNPDNPVDQLGLKQFESACNKIAVRPIRAPARSAGELAVAFQTLSRANAQGLIVASRSHLGWRDKIIESAAKNHLPAVYSRNVFVDDGGLIAYGPDYLDLYRRCAGYVDKIFKGAKPGDLPIEQPDKYELAINLKTAKALGISVPDAVLLRADKIIR